MPDRYLVEPDGRFWKVTDTETGESFLHLTETAARMAARTDVVTGVIPLEET